MIPERRGCGSRGASEMRNAMAKEKLQVVQGTTQFYFHVLPSDLERAVVSPEREAIFQYLSRLGSDRFVDFVVDVLVQVDGHKLVDRTDGPGDEKQDILTLDPIGRRHLTQCKFTINYEENTSGDELDLMFAACTRKNCESGLYVTNADLTVQAKRYVTDREYARGAKIPLEHLPAIDYWNGSRLWQRVSKSNEILNKWFSGTAQAHALRRFHVDLMFTRMPSGDPCSLDAAAFGQELTAAGHKVVTAPQSMSADVSVNDQLRINISDWFRAAGDLGVPFLLPQGGAAHGHPGMPIRTIRAQALLSEKVGAFNAGMYRDQIASVLASVLPDPGEGAWWHVVATGPQAFVFLQDVGKAVLASIEEPRAFVRAAGTMTEEKRYAFEPPASWHRVTDPDDPEDDAWHDEGRQTEIRMLVDQDVHPVSAFDLHLRQVQVIQKLRDHSFRAVAKPDATVIDAVRRLSHPDWFVLQSSNGVVLWAYPPGADPKDVEKLERALRRRGVQVQEVRDEDREHIVNAIDTHPTDVGTIVSSGQASTTPVRLDRRTFWLSRAQALQARPGAATALEVLKIKAGYELRHGYDLLGGKAEGTFASEELRRLLFDPLTFRGKRMMDVGLSGGMVSLHLRIRDGNVVSARELVGNYLHEFESLWAEVLKHLPLGVPNSPTTTEPSAGEAPTS
jgi:hypothetical protein